MEESKVEDARGAAPASPLISSAGSAPLIEDEVELAFDSGDSGDSGGRPPPPRRLARGGTAGSAASDRTVAWTQPETQAVAAECVPGPRAAHSADLLSGLLYVFGGWNGKKALNDLHVLDVATLTWRSVEVAGAPPGRRNNHTTAVVGKRVFIHGGHDGAKWLDDMHVLDTESLSWTRPAVAGMAPSCRACHTFTLLARKLYMFGGYDGSSCFNDVDVLDLDTMTWLQPRVTGMLPEPRNAHSMTTIGKRLLLFGGHSGNKHLRDLHVLDVESMSWSQPDVLGSAPPGLRGHTATLIGSQLFLFGGYDGRGRSNDLFVLEPDSLHWSQPRMADDDGLPAGRQRHSASLVAARLFVFGGFDGFKWLNDLHVLDIGALEASAITSVAVTRLLARLRSMLNNADLFADVVFIVEGRPIYAHRAILAAQCDQFRAMFSSGMKESHEREISIADWSYAAFLAMLEFFYTGSILSLPLEVAIDLLGLADHYTLASLKQLCENTLVHDIDVDNVCTLFSCAHRFMAAKLKRMCMVYIRKHFKEVSDSRGFEELGAEPQLLLEFTRESMRGLL